MNGLLPNIRKEIKSVYKLKELRELRGSQQEQCSARVTLSPTNAKKEKLQMKEFRLTDHLEHIRETYNQITGPKKKKKYSVIGFEEYIESKHL